MSGHNIAGKKVAFLLTDGVEQVELTSTWNAVKDAGGEPTLAAPRSGTLKSYTGTENGETFHNDRWNSRTSRRRPKLRVFP
ncbi:hypothetical protein NFC73_17535 [Pseudarthrobacter sp. RMG13]|uniref:Uncharacterized protein n=1 Tax=Pseudarthrobacter humi TaxID=2952523 RepID=A0ABT1LUH1_9MICC|nr:hypothetical protein [Pseudarthrobacter humi]